MTLLCEGLGTCVCTMPRRIGGLEEGLWMDYWVYGEAVVGAD